MQMHAARTHMYPHLHTHSHTYQQQPKQTDSEFSVVFTPCSDSSEALCPVRPSCAPRLCGTTYGLTGL